MRKQQSTALRIPTPICPPSSSGLCTRSHCENLRRDLLPSCLTWGHVLIHPLKEATLLLPWLGTGVELASFVGSILLYSPCDSRLPAQAGCTSITVTTKATKPIHVAAEA